MSHTYITGFYLNEIATRTIISGLCRLCLAANIPLVESGTAGYLGQVTVIRKVINQS